MDEKIAELMKKNKGILRQLTSLNNEVRQLKGRVRKLEKYHEDFETSIKMFQRRGLEIIPGIDMSEKEIANIKVGGTDPD